MHAFRDTRSHAELHGIEPEPGSDTSLVIVCERHQVVAPFEIFQAECQQCLVEHTQAQERARWENER